MVGGKSAPGKRNKKGGFWVLAKKIRRKKGGRRVAPDELLMMLDETNKKAPDLVEFWVNDRFEIAINMEKIELEGKRKEGGEIIMLLGLLYLAVTGLVGRWAKEGLTKGRGLYKSKMGKIKEALKWRKKREREG